MVMTTEELAEALLGLAALPPLDRAGAARALKEAAAAVLDAEAAAGMAGAVAAGMTQEGVAAALGTTGARVSVALKAHGLPGRKTGRPPGSSGSR
jgi:hypothetical protein